MDCGVQRDFLEEWEEELTRQAFHTEKKKKYNKAKASYPWPIHICWVNRGTKMGLCLHHKGQGEDRVRVGETKQNWKRTHCAPGGSDIPILSGEMEAWGACARGRAGQQIQLWLSALVLLMYDTKATPQIGAYETCNVPEIVPITLPLWKLCGFAPLSPSSLAKTHPGREAFLDGPDGITQMRTQRVGTDPSFSSNYKQPSLSSPRRLCLLLCGKHHLC